MDTMALVETLLRWIHLLAGVTWIGILYYFNFVQTPFFGTELGGQAKSAMTRGLVPNALWWFRWGAMFTFLSGLTILLMKLFHGAGMPLGSAYMTMILTGALMGTLMWANVWFVIWPAQQVVIANAENVAGGGEADPSAAGRAARAGLASRTNTLFSIPML
ncbi:MAG: urate hydroxylase PuuD, partial [Myxococcales bacterium]|nr:urate hydroxylase PuuD [Myxococcales bacterium]